MGGGNSSGRVVEGTGERAGGERKKGARARDQAGSSILARERERLVAFPRRQGCAVSARRHRVPSGGRSPGSAASVFLRPGKSVSRGESAFTWRRGAFCRRRPPGGLCGVGGAPCASGEGRWAEARLGGGSLLHPFRAKACDWPRGHLAAGGDSAADAPRPLLSGKLPHFEKLVAAIGAGGWADFLVIAE